MKALVSMRTIRAVYGALQGKRLIETRCEDELRALVHPAPAPAKKDVERKPRPTTYRKRLAGAMETGAIWFACFERAGGKCEACGVIQTPANPLELDHFFGRGRGRPPQSVANCWLLCRSCHKAKTNNRPSARYWWEEFAKHAAKHGYAAEETEARRRLAGIIAAREAASS